MLPDDHRTTLLAVAASAIETTFAYRDPSLVGRAVPAPSALSGPGASFVTLERGERLLGCVGSLEATGSLVVGVAHHAVAAAFADPRLPAVTSDDYEVMSIKVSVLSNVEPIVADSRAALVDVVRPGVDGLVVDGDGCRATLLPSVWRAMPDPADFLDALWVKAGLRHHDWPLDVTVLRYTTEEFGDRGPRPPVGARRARVPVE